MGRSSTLARLSLETSRSHGWIDEVLFGPLDFANAATYRRFLCMLYGFQAPLEAALARTPGIDFEFLAPRCKIARIASDLLALGLTRHEHALLARRQTIEPFTDVAQALGWMYSTERLMLRVDTLRARLENELPVVTSLANQFLYAYAGTAELRWRQFGAEIDRVAESHDVEHVVAAARAGIDALKSWLARYAPAKRLSSTTTIDRAIA